ncbi:MAG: EamA family transporter [Anaerolineae bacterium]|nr:EamA family transporter [Anaerolineae bacterium]MDQ7035793.1 EamA family transporter [Anaerolineae bacterium]
MASFTLPLIIISAIMHASWNLIAKRAKTNGVALVWLFAVFETLFFFPLTIIVYKEVQNGNLSWLAVGFMVGGGILHTLYFWLLSMGYRVGDLSIVYPIARGTGPLLATVGAILIFAERPTAIVLSGTLVISVGVIILTGNPRTLLQSAALVGVSYGLLTGLAVASYTLWDAYAMNQATLWNAYTTNQAVIAPLMYQGGLSVTRMLILLPFIMRNREDVVLSWQHDRWKAAAIALLSSVAYLIILFVLAFTPVTYVAPMRTLSILIGVLLGANLLKEKDARRRVIAASAIVVGVVLLNIS